MDYDKNARTGGEMAPDNAPPPYSAEEGGDSSGKPQPQNIGMKFSLAFVRTPPGLLMLINIVRFLFFFAFFFF